MRKLTLTVTARREPREISTRIASESASGSVARKFISGLGERCEKLARLPGVLGRSRTELPSGMRSVPHRGYTIFFRYIGDTEVEIVTILHAHRDVIAYFGDDVE